jgi:hypothetical protein
MITNGTITFERRITTGDYQHKQATVSLTFVLPEGAPTEAVYERVRAVANEAVARALAMVADATGGKANVKKQPVLSQPAQPSDEAQIEVLAAVSGPSLLKPAETLTAQPINAAWSGPTVGQKIGAPRDIMGAAINPADAPVDTEITDAQMVEAISSKNAHMLNAAADDMARQQVPVALHALVATFVPPPAKVQAIPAAKRAAFLMQLAAL